MTAKKLSIARIYHRHTHINTLRVIGNHSTDTVLFISLTLDQKGLHRDYTTPLLTIRPRINRSR
jgi:hypothetical protein